MQKTDLLYLWAYNHWANERVLRAAGQVTPDQFVAPAYLSHSSLRGALVHLVGVEQQWRMRFQEGTTLATLLSEAHAPTADSLMAIWSAETQAMQAFLNQLPAGEVTQSVTYTTTQGITYTAPLWQLLLHTMNHSMQFRSEASILLTVYHQSPGDLDLLIFQRAHQ